MFGLVKATLEALSKGEKLQPQISKSAKYKHWVSKEDFRRCLICAKMHGKIWLIFEIPNPNPPIHDNCRCKIEPMKTITAGTATTDGINGADWYIKNYKSGKRNSQRIIWSNDGLIFVTYDHYETFYEIV